MKFVASTGVQLTLAQIDRRELDRYTASNPVPEPPTRTVNVFGGDTEELPILDDAAYLQELQRYQMMIATQRLDLIANAIEIDSYSNAQELDELKHLGVAVSPANALRFTSAFTSVDLAQIVELVFYMSTVTQRGIDEAAASFAVTFMEKPVLAWKVGGSAAQQSALYEHWIAAQQLRYTWDNFCALPGPEQSQCVAFVRIQSRLKYLIKKY